MLVACWSLEDGLRSGLNDDVPGTEMDWFKFKGLPSARFVRTLITLTLNLTLTDHRSPITDHLHPHPGAALLDARRRCSLYASGDLPLRLHGAHEARRRRRLHDRLGLEGAS